MLHNLVQLKLGMEILFHVFKFFSWLLNFILMIIGGVILGMGIYALIETRQYGSAISSSRIITEPALMFIILGSLMVLISIIGLVGTLREIRIFLWFYALIISLILLAEIGVIAYLVYNFTQNRASFSSQIGEGLSVYIENYREDADLRALLDLAQSQLACCGINQPSDWDNNRYFNCSAPGIEACGVPNSCCKLELQINTQCGYQVRDPLQASRLPNINNIGCVEQLTKYISDNAILLGSIAGALLIAQVSAVILALMLSFDIPVMRRKRLQKKEQEAKYK